jgi:hypothetical protein
MQNPLDDYMGEIARRISSIPEPKRVEELREMRQHLANTIAANQELGESEEAAIANAIQQFGTPDEAANVILTAWRRLIRIVSGKTFLKIQGYWAIFYIFNILFMATKPGDLSRDLYCWCFTWIVGLLFMVVPAYWPHAHKAPVLDAVLTSSRRPRR